MKNYIVRRLLYAIPILLGVNVLTFVLFFMINTPDDMARAHLGSKNISSSSIAKWKRNHGYDLPLFYNNSAIGLQTVTNTLFFTKSIRLFVFDFGVSDAGRDISNDVGIRMWPSVNLAVLVLIIGLIVNITFAMLLTFFRSSCIDIGGVFICIVLMSISGLFYVIGGQYLLSKIMKLFPISGYDNGFESIKFLMVPVIVGVVGGIGASVRWYRTIFVEEINQDYIKMAKAKGLSNIKVFYKHLLGNAMLPILTGIVAIIPTLFMGSLVLESFFGIPGLGSYVIDAIMLQDFAIVRSMVFLGACLYIFGLILNDLSYVIFDPRVRLA